MVADPQLGFTLAHIGTMTSIFPMAYGVSKFAAGVLTMTMLVIGVVMILSSRLLSNPKILSSKNTGHSSYGQNMIGVLRI